MQPTRKPTRLEWYFARFMFSWWCPLLVGTLFVAAVYGWRSGGSALDGVLSILLGLELVFWFALRPFLVLDERRDAFAAALAAPIAERLSGAALQSLQPDRPVDRGPDGAQSLDVWCVGAPLGIEVSVTVAANDQGSDITVSSRGRALRTRGAVRRHPVNEQAIRAFRQAFERLALAEQPAT